MSLASSSALIACCSITRNHSMHQVCRKVDIYGRTYEYIYAQTHTLLPHTLICSAFQTSSAQPFRQREIGMSSFSSRLSQVFYIFITHYHIKYKRDEDKLLSQVVSPHEARHPSPNACVRAAARMRRSSSPFRMQT